MQDILSDLFGETPTLEVVKSYAERLGNAVDTGKAYQERGTGRIDVVRSGWLRRPSRGILDYVVRRALPQVLRDGTAGVSRPPTTRNRLTA